MNLLVEDFSLAQGNRELPLKNTYLKKSNRQVEIYTSQPRSYSRIGGIWGRVAKFS